MGYYLMCDIGKGLLRGEKSITFQIYSRYLNLRDSCFVDESDVISLDENIGLVRLISVNFKEDYALVGLNDVEERGISCYQVPRDNVQKGIGVRE